MVNNQKICLDFINSYVLICVLFCFFLINLINNVKLIFETHCAYLAFLEFSGTSIYLKIMLNKKKYDVFILNRGLKFRHLIEIIFMFYVSSESILCTKSC